MEALNNRRRRQERRKSGSALAAGFFDRRHIAERRLPETEILKLSDRDWQTYFGASTEPHEKSEDKRVQDTEKINKKRDQ